MALHCPLSPLALAASIQLDATLPNFLVQEHNEVNDYRDSNRTLIGKGYLKDPFVLDEDGCVAVPDKPGLGIELDDEGIAGAYHVHALGRNTGGRGKKAKAASCRLADRGQQSDRP